MIHAVKRGKSYLSTQERFLSERTLGLGLKVVQVWCRLFGKVELIHFILGISTLCNLSTCQKLGLRFWHDEEDRVTEYTDKDLWAVLRYWPNADLTLASFWIFTKWKSGYGRLRKCELDCNCIEHQCFSSNLLLSNNHRTSAFHDFERISQNCSYIFAKR